MNLIYLYKIEHNKEQINTGKRNIYRSSKISDIKNNVWMKKLGLNTITHKQAFLLRRTGLDWLVYLIS